MAQDIKRIDIAELRSLGVLHELNRLFLHPLGLALEVRIDEDGKESLGGVWDYREDPEGILFDTIDMDKIMSMQSLAVEQHRRRKEALGFVIQIQSRKTL